MADETNLNAFRNFARRISNIVFVRYIGLVLLLLSTTVICSSIAYYHAHRLSTDWASTLQPQLSLVRDNDMSHFCMPQNPLAENDRLRLEQDYREIRSRMAHHLVVLSYFYANYFRAVWIGSILGAIAGICLFYIANKGWANANNYVIVVFVFSTVFGAFFLSYITIFQQQENISDNKRLYLQYVALGNEILTYCATGTSDEPAITTTDKYLRSVDTRMAAINNIAVGFDYSKVPNYSEILSTAQKSKTGQQPSASSATSSPSDTTK